ncbi:60S ribosomal protein L23a [Galemys pyrenaicus]|uniref:60S ribosomal protein L23a n=1 Tax=Galemys pyrenaicus TaxID=202257 RepID=A0A8J6A5R9_GALPY|nr:60S ribosomal protein L23a [Galemys pyrenaicus]
MQVNRKDKGISGPQSHSRPVISEDLGQVPPTTESGVKKTDDNTHVSTVSVEADQHEIKPVGKKFYETDMAKVNVLTRPDGEKQAYIPSDCDDLDVANKIGII